MHISGNEVGPGVKCDGCGGVVHVRTSDGSHAATTRAAEAMGWEFSPFGRPVFDLCPVCVALRKKLLEAAR